MRMRRFAAPLAWLLLVLWVGGLWSIGYIAAPTLFAAIGDRALAGSLAGRMFSWMAYVGIAAGIYLTIFILVEYGVRALRETAFWLTLAMLMLALVGHFGIQPILATLRAEAWPAEVMKSMVRSRFAAWHGVASVLYLLQSMLGAVLVLVARKAIKG